MHDLSLVDEYQQLLEGLKQKVKSAQMHATLAVNRELLALYWDIGKTILTRQAELGWGAKVIDQLAQDLRAAFPKMKGLSPRNLKYMRALAEAWPDGVIVQQAVAQLPWGHCVRILDKAKTSEERDYYVLQALDRGWSRDVLVAQIDSGLYHRQGRAVTNFMRTLPPSQSAQAKQVLKDPYVFDFLLLSEEAEEREVEGALIKHVEQFLIELGAGFAFLGRQVHLEVGGEDFYIDLLFYNVRLHRYVVIELKNGEFRPEHAGKMNFYLSAVDEQIRDPTIDGPSIGLLLCRSKNRVVVEYALRDTHKPIGVSSWQLTRALPEDLSPILPTVDQLEAELQPPFKEEQ